MVRRYLTNMKTSLSSKGQVILPAEIREQDRLRPGQKFDVQRLRKGRYLLQTAGPGHGGLFQWLSSCPERDWFERISSESTADLK